MTVTEELGTVESFTVLIEIRLTLAILFTQLLLCQISDISSILDFTNQSELINTVGKNKKVKIPDAKPSPFHHIVPFPCPAND